MSRCLGILDERQVAGRIEGVQRGYAPERLGEAVGIGGGGNPGCARWQPVDRSSYWFRRLGVTVDRRTVIGIEEEVEAQIGGDADPVGGRIEVHAVAARREVDRPAAGRHKRDPPSRSDCSHPAALRLDAVQCAGVGGGVDPEGKQLPGLRTVVDADKRFRQHASRRGGRCCPRGCGIETDQTCAVARQADRRNSAVAVLDRKASRRSDPVEEVADERRALVTRSTPYKPTVPPPVSSA